MIYRAFPLVRSVSPDKLVYVGVHNRRTDHLQYQLEGGWRIIQPGYFLEGLEVYRQWARQSNKHPLFLFVSDDLDWAREELLPRIKTKGCGGAGGDGKMGEKMEKIVFRFCVGRLW